MTNDERAALIAGLKHVLRSAEDPARVVQHEIDLVEAWLKDAVGRAPRNYLTTMDVELALLLLIE